MVVHWEPEGQFIVPFKDAPKKFTAYMTNEISQMWN